MQTWKQSFTKRLLSGLVAVMMLLSLLPTAAFAAGSPVAQIGDTPYDTLDAALEAVSGSEENNITIKLLASCDQTTRLSVPAQKILTITADPNSGIVITDDTRKGITFGQGSTLIVENIAYNTNAQIAFNASGTMIFRNAELNMDGEMHQFHSDGYYCSAIFADQPSSMTFDHSTVTIQNYPSTGSAIRWNGADEDSGYNLSIVNGSDFSSTNCYAGFTGTYDILIEDSVVDVSGHRGNGSNGSNFTIVNSKVNFSNNGSHGLSTADLTITDSIVTANNNGNCGIVTDAGGTVTITTTETGKTEVTVIGNAHDNSNSAAYAGMRLYGNHNHTISGNTTVKINDNKNTGLYVRRGSLTVADSVDMEIIGNSVTNNNMDGYGGGIYVGYSTYTDVGAVTLPADAKIYNNHALAAGDDIYVASGNGTVPSLTFGEVGSNWVLNDCEHFIDGWYQDGSGNRWVGHAETPEENNMELFPVEGSTTVTGLTALKAAHGEDYQKKTSLPGLEKKVETTNEEGETVWGDATSANANDKVNFQLTSNVPEDLLNYLMPEDAEDPKVDTPQNAALLAGDPLEGRGSYVLTFHDVMDGHLAFDANSVSVTIGSKPLDDEYYTVHVPGATHGEGEDAETCTFEITLDLVDLYNRGLITDEDISAATPITVTYIATLDKDVTAGEYLNTAWVSYPTDETEKDTVTVDTYDINIFKYDQSTSEGLNGAQFELYGAGAYTKDEEGNWTKVDGAEPIRTGITSGMDDYEDGYVTINGLAEGTYYLVETQAPEGYVASEKPLEIVIPEKADTENVVHVQFANSPIPHTGGMGTTMYTVGGTAILALGGALFVLNRKKLQQA